MKIIKLPELHNGQKRVLKSIEEAGALYNVIRSGRQFGKSFLLTSLLIYYSYNKPHYHLPNGTKKTCVNLYTSITIKQAKKVFRETARIIKQFDKSVYINKTEMLIVLSNNVEIHFLGVNDSDNIRGMSVAYMFCDEFAFYKPETWSKVLSKMLTVSGQKAFISSTPNGKHNEFYKLDLLGYSSNPMYHSVKATYKENEHANLNIVEDAKLTTPPDIFEQEYLAEFIESGGEVFKNVKRVCTIKQFEKPIPGKRYFGGVDFGVSDNTVLTILDENRRVVLVFCINGLGCPVPGEEWLYICDQLIPIIQEYHCTLYAESNGVGQTPVQILKSKHPETLKFVTSPKTKKEIIEELIRSINTNEITLLDEEFYPQQFNELASYIIKGDKYTAPAGLHDDHVMSLCFANWCYKKYRHTSEFIVIPYSNPNRY